MSEETLSVRFVRVLLDACKHRGVANSRFLAAAGWQAHQLEHADGRVPSEEFYRLCELALDLTGDPKLGLLAARVVRPQSVDLIGQLVAHAPNVRQAVESHLRVQKLTGDRSRYSLLEDKQGATLRYACPTTANPRVRRFLSEMHMSGFYLLFRYFARGANPTQVCFEYTAPDYAADYERIFKVVRFGQAFTEISFDRQLMSRGRRYSDAEIHRTLSDLAQSRISRLERGVRCADRLRTVLSAPDKAGRITMTWAARELGMSRRSLRRRLADEGTSFDAVFSAALADRARRLLSIEGRTIQETAFALGYSDSTAFHRAFKRWTGTTPKAWRKEALDAQAGSSARPMSAND